MRLRHLAGHYPHTNDSLLAVGIFIDDMVQDNGPLQIIPASHTGEQLTGEPARSRPFTLYYPE